MFTKSTQFLKPFSNPNIAKFKYCYKIYRYTTMTESPELPFWVRFTESQTLVEDDNFILPNSLYWSEKIKIEKNQIGKIDKIENEPINDVDLVSKVLEKRFRSVVEVEKELGKCNVVVSEDLVDKILRRFSNDCVSSLGFFNWAKTRVVGGISADLYNLMVYNLGKCKRFDLLWELVEEMVKIEGYVTLMTLTTVMRRLAKARRYEEAIGVFREIERFGVEKDIESMNVLIDTLVKEHSVENAHKVFLEFKGFVEPNASTFNMLVHGWCKYRDVGKAREVVSEMEREGFSPDVFSYTCFVEFYCREKDFRQVDLVLNEMEEKGVLPNSVTYTILMHALGKAKELNKALEVYEKIKRNGCDYDASVYSSLIFILGKSGRLKDAREVFDEMPRRGVNPDKLAYNTMIAIVCEHSQEENALKLLGEMEESGCKPNTVTYAPLLKLFCKKQRMKVLSFLLKHMFENGVSIDLGTYTLLVRGLCNSKKLEQACLFFEEMVMRGFVPMDCTVEMLKKGLEGEGMHTAKARVEELSLQAKS